jgi:hypothetical protein
MKLSPPVSSSDLEAAREIARRLHQRRRRQDRPGPEDQAAALRGAPRPRSESPAPLAASPGPAPVTPPPPAFGPAPEARSRAGPASEAPLRGGLGDLLAGFGEPAAAAEAVTDTAEHPPDSEVGGTTFSPEEMVGSAWAPQFDGIPEPEPYEAPPSPFDVELDETGAPAPPSWDDIVETCLGLAQAKGAMLIDPAGQVFAARGEWPAPGPDAIAAKLVSTMERTLRDAPTRSISAPLMGKHLTAWRVPLSEGLVTAAFIGAAPVRAEARPAIDTEIHRGAGA